MNDKTAEDCLSFNVTYVLVKNVCHVKASSAGAKIVRKFSEKGNRLNDRTSRFAKKHRWVLIMLLFILKPMLHYFWNCYTLGAEGLN